MVKGAGGLPNELLYGRVGYLYSLVFVNQQLGQDRIPLQYIQQVGRGGGRGLRSLRRASRRCSWQTASEPRVRLFPLLRSARPCWRRAISSAGSSGCTTKPP